MPPNFSAVPKSMQKGLAVADVQVAVGLRGEAGVNGHALVLAAGGDILLNKRVNKVLGLLSLEFLSHLSILLG